MINDGYTIHYPPFRYRPLLPESRQVVRDLAGRQKWYELETFLWREPFLFGKLPASDDDKKLLFLHMTTNSREGGDLENLKAGLQLFFENPMLGLRDCDLCQQWWFDHDTGLICQNANGPIRRPSHARVPCDTSAGCAKGHHENPLELSHRNKQAWKHFLEWRHIGLPDSHRQCPIVRRNWAIMGNMVEKYGLPSVCH